MPKLPALTGNELINILEKICFQIVRQKGSHIRMQHEDAQVVTIPVHAGKNIGRGLLSKILRDAEITREECILLLE
ncbi:MAG: type II toxin-antitoxin system HicA family toxin [Tatlockia sp.]|nr:type II toxin-antitoxin system HicA family toxin [Tatlockia sp.]